MERRHKPASRNASTKVKKDVARKNSLDLSSSFPHISDLICEGEITIGEIVPIGCVATASDEHNTLAMLVRRKRETLFQLLTRLDEAIAKAYDEDVFTDEVNC